MVQRSQVLLGPTGYKASVMHIDINPKGGWKHESKVQQVNMTRRYRCAPSLLVGAVEVMSANEGSQRNLEEKGTKEQ